MQINQNVTQQDAPVVPTGEPVLPGTGGMSLHGQAKAASITIQTNRKGFIEVAGEVLELLPAATFRVMLENEKEILCHLSGRMRMHRIMLLPGDKVRVEMTPYDMSKGRITYRF